MSGNGDEEQREFEALLQRSAPKLLRAAKRFYAERGRGVIVLEEGGQRYQSVDELRAMVTDDPLGLIDKALLYDPEREAIVVATYRPGMKIAIRVTQPEKAAT